MSLPTLLTRSGSQHKGFEFSAFNESFSMCGLTLDDTSRLSEWLSYHYFALPLGYLVVAVDPSSQISPSHIFDRWRNRITIIEWNDTDFLPNPEYYLRKAEDSSQKKTDKHRERQGHFYRECALHMKRKNRTWTFFYDTDEYVSINKDFFKTSVNPSSKPGHILPYLKELTQATNRSREWPYKAFQKFLPCLSIPRAAFSANESSAAERNKDVPAFLNASNFDTLRFRYRSTPRKSHHGVTKSLIDISQVKPEHFKLGGGAHSGLKSICNPTRFNNYDKMPLHIHHFVGSYEAYFFKDDPRRSAASWKALGFTRHDYGQDDELRPWIQSFVNFVGEEQAKYLLQDAGIVPPKQSKNIPQS